MYVYVCMYIEGRAAHYIISIWLSISYWMCTVNRIEHSMYFTWYFDNSLSCSHFKGLLSIVLILQLVLYISVWTSQGKVSTFSAYSLKGCKQQYSWLGLQKVSTFLVSIFWKPLLFTMYRGCWRMET